MKRSAFALGLVLALHSAKSASADPEPAVLAPDAQIQFSTQPPQPEARTEEASPKSLDEPPPLRPRKKGLVVESSLGALAFVGEFRHVAPPAYWIHAQLGYELLSWLMVFGEGELALTDTSEAADESHSFAFPMWGFGGGGRITVHATERVAALFQGEIGAIAANVPHNALTYLGYRGAESLGMQFGGRVGVEWYQADPHLALSLEGGPRYAQGFSKFASSDLPLMWDVAVGLRYAF